MNILRAFEIYTKQQQQVQELEPRNLYRLYYSDTERQVAHGPPWPDLDWPWIEITKDQAKNMRRYRLVGDKLQMIDTHRLGVVKYIESESGEYAVAADHMCILIEPGEHYHAIKRVSPNSDRHS